MQRADLLTSSQVRMQCGALDRCYPNILIPSLSNPAKTVYIVGNFHFREKDSSAAVILCGDLTSLVVEDVGTQMSPEIRYAPV